MKKLVKYGCLGYSFNSNNFALDKNYCRKGKIEMPTPTMEDYIEQIYNLIQLKGYARVSDIAEELLVHPSSVTKMVQKLDKDNFVNYEKYRGFVLTEKGEEVGEKLVYRHDLLEDFLEIIGVAKENIYDDVEGIEHHLSWNSIDRIGDLVRYFEADKNRIKELKAMQTDKFGSV